MLKQGDTRQVFNRSLTFVAAMSALIGIVPPTAAQSTTGAHIEAAAHDLYTNLNELKWEKLLPELGAGSPEITILHVDPVSGASQLMIRSPANYHAPPHWHTANETHLVVYGTFTMKHDGGEKEKELGPGGFN